jgi:hypothetical protein
MLSAFCGDDLRILRTLRPVTEMDDNRTERALVLKKRRCIGST